MRPSTIERLVQRWVSESGQRVADARIAKGWKRSQLATKARTTEATIHRIEHGLISPKDTLKLSIANALGVQPGELWPSIVLPESVEAA